jgi:hypothetical protein
MADSVKVLGVDEAIMALNKRIKMLQTSTLKAKRKIGYDLKAKSVKLAPLDNADLRGSGFMKTEGDYVIVGFTQPYALKQHEHTEYKHPKGGQAKYLEQPLKDNLKKYIKILEDSTKEAVE